MITVSGGKWTTYRKMAEDAINVAVSVGELHPVRQSCTSTVQLLGAQAYTPITFTEVRHIGGNSVQTMSCAPDSCIFTVLLCGDS